MELEKTKAVTTECLKCSYFNIKNYRSIGGLYRCFVQSEEAVFFSTCLCADDYFKQWVFHNLKRSLCNFDNQLFNFFWYPVCIESKMSCMNTNKCCIA